MSFPQSRIALTVLISSVLLFTLQFHCEDICAQQNAPFDISHISDETGLVLAVRLRQIFSNESIKPLSDRFNDKAEQDLGFKVEQVEQIVFSGKINQISESRIFISIDGELNGRKYLQKMASNTQSEQLKYLGETYFKSNFPTKGLTPNAKADDSGEAKPVALWLWQPDEKSAIVGPEDEIRKYMKKQTAEHQKLLKERSWKEIERHSIALTFDSATLQEFVDRVEMGSAIPPDLTVLAECIKHAGIGLNVGKELSLFGAIQCKSPTHSRKARDAVEKLCKLGALMIQFEIVNSNEKGSPEANVLNRVAQLLTNVVVTRDDNIVKLESTASMKAFGETAGE